MIKYINLFGLFKNDKTFDMTEGELVGAEVAFQWIDQNLELVPGQAMTVSQVQAETEGMPTRYINGYMDALKDAGITVVPDPTNEERLTEIIESAVNSSAWENAEALAEYLHDNGVKVGGDDE